MTLDRVLAVVQAERRRNQHRYAATRRQRALLVLASVVFLPIGLGIMFGAYNVGRSVATGEAAFLQMARWYLPAMLVVVAFFGVVNAGKRLLGFEARDLLLTTLPSRELVAALLVAEGGGWLLGIVLPATLVVAAFGVGTGSALTTLVAVGVTALLMMSSLLVGTVLGLAGRLGLARVPLSRSTRSLLGTVGQVSGALVGAAAGALVGSRAAQAEDVGLDALVPAGPPPVPLGYYGDWLFVGTPVFEGVSVAAAGSLVAVCLAIPLSVVAVERLLVRLWYVDPSLPTPETAPETTTVSGGWIGTRSGLVLVTVGLLRRAFRQPARHAHVAYYLIALGMFTVGALGNPEVALLLVGFSLVVLGVLLGGGLFGLNPLGEEGGMLGQLVLSTTPARTFVRARTLAGLLVGLSLVGVGSALLLVGGLDPADAALLVPFWTATCLVSATLGQAIGTLYPRTEPGSVLDTTETLPPSMLTLGVHGVVVSAVTVVGTALVAFPVGGQWRPTLLAGLVGLLVVLGDGGYRYAVAAIADYGRETRPGRLFTVELSVGLALLGLVASNSATLAVILYAPLEGLPAFVATFLAGYAGYATVVVAYVLATDSEWSRLGVRVPRRSDARPLVVGLVASFGALGALVAGVALLGIPVAQHSIVSDILTGGPSVALVLVALALLVNGPIEELLFRGVIQGRLATVFDERVAIGLAAAVFSLVHVPAYATGPLPGMAVTLSLLGVLGVVWGWVYARTESVVPAALCHGLYNAVLFGVAYVSVL